MANKSGQRRGQKSRGRLLDNLCPCGKEARVAGDLYGRKCLREIRKVQPSYGRDVNRKESK